MHNQSGGGIETYDLDLELHRTQKMVMRSIIMFLVYQRDVVDALL